MYIQLISSFIKVEHLRVHMPNDLPDMGPNVMGAHSNIERMMQSLHEKFQAAAHVWVSSCL